jgi:uncharacterized protein (TIGR03792 family)
MVIEWLRFEVPPEQWEAFICRDEEVWTVGLKNFSGFLGKEVWIDPVQQNVVMIIRWNSKEEWKSIPTSELERLDAMMGDLRMPIIESREYRVP